MDKQTVWLVKQNLIDEGIYHVYACSSFEKARLKEMDLLIEEVNQLENYAGEFDITGELVGIRDSGTMEELEDAYSRWQEEDPDAVDMWTDIEEVTIDG